MKSNSLPNIWLFVLVLILLTLSAWGIFYVPDIKDKISIFGIIAVIVAAFTSVLTVNINNNKTHEREYNFLLLKEKQKVCSHFYNAYFEILSNGNKKDRTNTKKAFEEMLLFKRGLMNWGSGNLIEKFIEFDNKLAESESDNDFLLNQGNQFLLDLRKELGFKDTDNLSIMSVILTPKARKEINKSQ